MQELLEDFSRWKMEELIEVPPESLEYVDLIALVIKLQDLLENYMYRDKEGEFS